MASITADLHRDYESQFVLKRPQDRKLKRLIRESGFNAVVGGKDPDANRVKGRFGRRKGYKVEPEYAGKLQDFATSHLFSHLEEEKWFKLKSKSIYRTLIECMSNTKGHASPDGTEIEEWWLSVYCDDKKRAAKFSFVDNGIGILKSGNVRILKRMEAMVRNWDDGELIKKIFDGKLKSRTRQNGRGKGLPAMKSDCVDHGLLDNLIVITNNVKANVSRGSYETLQASFSGTFLYWELSGDKTNHE